MIYQNGQSEHYPSQFYEPYQFYPPFIFAIPGNHDGDTHVEKGDASDSEPTLNGFITNFCAPQATAVTAYRESMTQPYVFWTLDAPFLTVIGLYSNVDGSLDGRGSSSQQSWLADQLKAAPQDKCLIVTVHHPVYSLDTVHGGSPDVVYALEMAAQASGRTPDAVLSGHVHSYQRFTRTVEGRAIPYLIAAGAEATPTVQASSTRSRKMPRASRSSSRSPRPSPASSSSRPTRRTPASFASRSTPRRFRVSISPCRSAGRPRPLHLMRSHWTGPSTRWPTTPTRLTLPLSQEDNRNTKRTRKREIVT